MTLAETLLQKLADWRPAGEDRPTVVLALPEHGWSVRLVADKVDYARLRFAEVEADPRYADRR